MLIEEPDYRVKYNSNGAGEQRPPKLQLQTCVEHKAPVFRTKFGIHQEALLPTILEIGSHKLSSPGGSVCRTPIKQVPLQGKLITGNTSLNLFNTVPSQPPQPPHQSHTPTIARSSLQHSLQQTPKRFNSPLNSTFTVHKPQFKPSDRRSQTKTDFYQPPPGLNKLRSYMKQTPQA